MRFRSICKLNKITSTIFFSLFHFVCAKCYKYHFTQNINFSIFVCIAYNIISLFFFYYCDVLYHFYLISSSQSNMLRTPIDLIYFVLGFSGYSNIQCNALTEKLICFSYDYYFIFVVDN